MHGLKNVRNRRTDALTQVGWDQLEVMLAVYYRGQGYRVDQVGTGGTGARFDGGIDLKLYKDDAYIVVQCKHWNAKQVTHNAVHELLGIMITQGATGAILVTSGEFSRAAIEAATKQGHVQMVDGDDLREKLGQLPEVAPSVSTVRRERGSVAGDLAAHVGGRLLDAAEDRIRGRTPPRQSTRGVIRHAMDAGLGIVLVKLVVGLIIFLVMTHQIQSVIRGLQPTRTTVGSAPTTVVDAGKTLPVPTRLGSGPVLVDNFSGMTIEGTPVDTPAYRAPSGAEIRESKRQADEAMRVLERSTPEM